MTSICYLSEIFSAIQGEGQLVGNRQIFIRFGGCDLRCVWCDTPESLQKTPSCQVETQAGKRIFKSIKNPITEDTLIKHLYNLEPKLHHSLSLTGGEPLLQSDFINAFLGHIKKDIKIPVLLESGGHRPKELEKIISKIDYLSMDFKLESSAKTKDLIPAHKDYLSIAIATKNLITWVKIIISENTLEDEILESVSIIKNLQKNKNELIEIYIQPVTEINNIKPPKPKQMLKIQLELLKLYPKIRVIPQVHKFINQK